MAKYLRIVEWEKYQHYKDRNPPWIKLHGELLHSYTWTVLDDASRLLAIACMLLASQTENKIPLDRDYIQRRTLLNKRPDVRPLIDVGFAQVVDDQVVVDSASEMLADASTLQANARPETETEADIPKKELLAFESREVEAEIPKKKRASRLPEQWIPNPGHYQLAKELSLIVDVELPSFRDHFLGTGAVKLDWDATFRNWLRRAAEYGGRNGQTRRPNQEKPRTNAAVERWQNNRHRAEQELGIVVPETYSDGPGHAPRLGSGSAPLLEGRTGPVRGPGNS